MRIVVTGAAGYVGSALMEALREYETVEVDWHRGEAPMGRDYRDTPPRLFKGADAVVHLAAHSSVKACQDRPADAWHNNVTGFYEMLDNIKAHNPVATLIYASSASVYNGIAGQASEDAALLPPAALYDATKRTMDDLARLSGLRAYGLRFGTISGPSPQMRPELLINAMTRSAIERGHVTVQNGGARRSVAGISDVVAATLHLLDGRAEPGVYNVASAHGTIESIGREVAYHCGVPCVIDPHPSPCYDFQMSTAKLEATGWRPQATVASIVRELQEVYRVATYAA
jgi:nucleoside-diphosphate-sugar epimerase